MSTTATKSDLIEALEAASPGDDDVNVWIEVGGTRIRYGIDIERVAESADGDVVIGVAQPVAPDYTSKSDLWIVGYVSFRTFLESGQTVLCPDPFPAKSEQYAGFEQARVDAIMGIVGILREINTVG